MRADGDQAAAISMAVVDLPGVAGFSAGEFGQIGTFSPHHFVPGVRVDAEQVRVHIVATYGVSLQNTADIIGAAIAPWLAGRVLHVAVEDILLPGEHLLAAESPATSGRDAAISDAAISKAPISDAAISDAAIKA